MLVLGIDQAGKSGWAIVRALDAIRASGVAKKSLHVRQVVELALGMLEPGEPLVAVLEDHSGIPLSNKTQYDKKRGHLGQRGRDYQARTFTYPAAAQAARPDAPAAPTRNTATILGMGDARGMWKHELALTVVPGFGTGVPVSMVEPWKWGLEVLGLPRSMPTDERKKRSVFHAQALLKRAVADDNEADAVCIALWGARNVAVPEPKHMRAGAAR